MPKLRNGLSQKMKNFCCEYVRTGSSKEAYLKAYDTTNERIAGQEGSKLLLRDDVMEYIMELNKPIVNKVTNEREKKRKIIWNRIEKAIARNDDTAIARYMDILNRMDSEYVNINRNVDDSSETLASLNTEQLKQLLNEETTSE